MDRAALCVSPQEHDDSDETSKIEGKYECEEGRSND